MTNILSLYIIYNYLQNSIQIFRKSSYSIVEFLLQQQQQLQSKKKEKITNSKNATVHSKPISKLFELNQWFTFTALMKSKEEDFHRLHILYPSRNKTKDMNIELFFPTNKQNHVPASAARVTSLKHQSQTVMPVSSNYTAPREPIVLCHGLYGFDLRGPESLPALQLHYWSGVEETLAKLGCKVIVTKVPQTGSIWERSHALHDILQKTIIAGKKVNFVAHSMGGLDCRHLLANIKDRPYRVESLTTICTPHRGSPIMDWFRDNMGLGRRHCTEYTKSNYSSPSWSPQANTSVMTSRQNLQRHANTTNAYTHSNPANYITPAVARLQAWTDKVITKYLDEPAYAHLTTDFCNNYFNENTPNDPTVQYYSYGAAAQSPVWWSSMLSLPWQMVYEKEGDNDGFVSVKSAAWGNYVKTIEDADHWDFTGKSYIPYRFKSNSKDPKNKAFDKLEFYAELATHLYRQGH